jgi:urease accessory protein
MVPAHRQGRAELTFVRRGGRTVLAHSRATAPMTLVRPFALGGGRQLVQLITLGPGYCGGDRVQIQITAEEGADAVVTTTAATRVLSMRPGADAAQDVRIFAGRGATVQYYPLPTIPFPDSAFAQTLTVDADPTARVGALETFAMGRTARDEYLAFRTLASRTTLMVAGAPIYVDATELDPGATALAGIGVLAGRRYLASGFWYGLTIAETPREGAGCGDVLTVFAASRPGLSYLRALASDGPALDGVLREAIGRVAAAWGYPPLALDRYRC